MSTIARPVHPVAVLDPQVDPRTTPPARHPVRPNQPLPRPPSKTPAAESFVPVWAPARGDGPARRASRPQPRAAQPTSPNPTQPTSSGASRPAIPPTTALPTVPATAVLPGDYTHPTNADSYAANPYGDGTRSGGRTQVRAALATIAGWWNTARRKPVADGTPNSAPAHPVGPQPNPAGAQTHPAFAQAAVTPAGSKGSLLDRRPLLAVWSTIGAGLLLVTGFWSTGLAPLKSTGDLLVAAAQLLGLYSGFLVIVLLALMARVPRLENTVGAGRLGKVHGMVGRYTVIFVVLHGLFMWWGTSAVSHFSLTRGAGGLLVGYPYAIRAAVAGFLLIAVGIYSARAVRLRVRYETWYLLHLGTYVAIYLGFAHQIAAGAHFASNAVARTVWTALYLGVAALLVWFRLLVPLAKALRHRLVVAAVRPEAPGVVSIYLAGSSLSKFGAESGQFVRLRFLVRGSWWQSHPFSLSAAPNARWLRVTIKALGDHTNHLQVLRPGTKVFVEGPYGAFTEERRTQPGVVLVAGGAGVTPLRALFESLPAEPGQLTLIYRASTPADVVFRTELDTIAATRGATVHYLVGPRGNDERPDPLNPDDVRRLVPDIAVRDAYVCGPAGMTVAARTVLRACGVPANRIHREEFAFSG